MLLGKERPSPFLPPHVKTYNPVLGKERENPFIPSYIYKCVQGLFIKFPKNT